MRLSSIAISAVLVVTAVGGQSINAYAESTLHEKVTDISMGRISPQQETIISSSADKVLRRIAQARGDLNGKDYDEASEELQKAQKLLAIITDGLPTTKVKDRIWVAKKHLQYENTKTVLPDFVPIFSSLDDVADMVPTQLTRRHLDEARNALKKGKKDEADTKLREASAALIYTEEDLPLQYTKRHVNQAVTDIRGKHYKQADKLLKSAEDSVNSLSMDVPSPLTVAKDALRRSADHYFVGEQTAARSELKKAIKYLKKAAQGNDEISAKMSGDLVHDSKRLLPELADRNQSTEDQLGALLERVRALAERDTESYSTAWDILQGPNPVKPLVIQAQLHLAYAETDVHVEKKDKAAAKQLTQVISLLKKAEAKAGAPFRKTLASVVKEVSGLKSDASSGSESRESHVTSEYEMDKGQLRQLIMEM